ncbi:MAG: hypothetical protein HKO62_01020 [Gammaproteobacteria bacterium]|nr:hypothetical protein [Gammaproteobacteria bacterium]NNL99298.1 hypothetical protein [Gammaproteobacteria bacterium]
MSGAIKQLPGWLRALPALLALAGCNGEPPEAPYALWRDGKIVKIRHCRPPADAAAYRACAGLVCQQTIATLLANPMEAQLRETPATDGMPAAGTPLEISGQILYRTSISQPLPTRYGCTVRNLKVTATTLNTPGTG